MTILPNVHAPAPLVERDDFDGFYLAHFGDTVTLSYAYTADLAEAQDIAQEAFSRAWQRWDAVAGYENPAAWVRRVAYNLAHSRWRRVRTAAAYLVRQRPEPAPELNPDHVALVAALRRLPRRQREAIVWHHIADVPVDDVAHQLQVPVGTVKTWLRRGRTAMARELGIEVRHHVTTPPADEVVRRAGKQRRAKVSAVAAAIVAVIALAAGAFHFLRPTPPPPPITPTPTPSTVDNSVDINDPMRTVDWKHATVTMIPTAGCPSGPVPFSPSPHNAYDAGYTDPKSGERIYLDTRTVALGDVTADGRAEAVLLRLCAKDSMSTSRELVLIQRDSAGGLAQIGAADPSHPVFRRVWTFWISGRTLHMDGSSFPDQTIGTAYSWRWTGSAFEAVDSASSYPEIGFIDLSPVSQKLSCQGLPSLPEAELRLTFGRDLVLTGRDRRWDLNKSRRHPKFAENGRIGNPYLVLTVACGRIGGSGWDEQLVTFDRVGGQWRAVSVGPPMVQA